MFELYIGYLDAKLFGWHDKIARNDLPSLVAKSPVLFF